MGGVEDYFEFAPRMCRKLPSNGAPMEPIHGLLYSQIGYDLGLPIRVIARSTQADELPEGSRFTVVDVESGEAVAQGEAVYWGALWHSHWWVADTSGLPEGTYRLSFDRPGADPLESGPFVVGDNLLWRETVVPVALEQMEARQQLARYGKGWKDCGAEWREANSHASTIIGLTDLLNLGFEHLSPTEVERLVGQIVHGCDYLVACQDAGEMAGLGRGAVAHELPNHILVIPGDQVQAAAALARAARLVFEHEPQKSAVYLDRAERAFRYFLYEARPYGPQGFSHWNHGAPPGYMVPQEWMTRDLMMALHAGVELWKAGRQQYQPELIRLAREIMDRQVPEEKAEDGLHGHFYLFPGCGFTEKVNTHHHIGHDTGSSFPHYLFGFFEMSRLFYDHPDAPRWREMVERFAYGYFLPACRRNPFYLIPEGVFLEEGLLTFSGPWHGMNTTIGFGAALAAQLESYLGDGAFRDIAVGNLQWIAGLNAGLTREMMAGCVIWEEEIPEGQALPYSQISGIGTRSAGNWTGIRGTIPNGFSNNPQFQLKVEPTRESDGPWYYTDEDWIPHGAGWLSGLSILRQLRFFRG
jgi:hypothetical protein